MWSICAPSHHRATVGSTGENQGFAGVQKALSDDDAVLGGLIEFSFFPFSFLFFSFLDTVREAVADNKHCIL